MGLSGSDSSVESGSICGSYYATRPMRSMIRAIDAAAPRPGGAPGQGNASMGQQAVKAMQEKDMSNVIMDNGISTWGWAQRVTRKLLPSGILMENS